MQGVEKDTKEAKNQARRSDTESTKRIKSNKKGEVRERGLPEIKRIMGKIILANELEEKYKKIFEKLKQK